MHRSVDTRSIEPAAGSGPAGMSRRRLAWAAALSACCVAWPGAAAGPTRASSLRVSRELMGTRIDIVAQGADRSLLGPAVDAAFARIEQLAQQMSHYEPTSHVSAINLAAGLRAVPVPGELMQVLAMAQTVSQRSGGAFDVTVGSVGRWHFGARDPRMPTPSHIAARLPLVDYRKLSLDPRAGTVRLAARGMRIDPGGIAKLFILDAAMKTLRDHGLDTALVNGGGDVLAMSAAAARPWRVGIRDPRQPHRLLGAVDLRQGFVASSGDYERFFVRDGRRYHHVIDPRTGYPAAGPHGVTLIGSDLASVNGLGAAAMVLGMDAARELLRSTPGVDALIAGRDNSLWLNDGMRSRLVRS